MHKRLFVAVGALVALGVAGRVEAQTSSIPLSVEVRGGAAFPTGDFGDQAETGFGFDANAGLNLTPLLGVYAGFSRFEFGIDEGISGVDVDANWVESGLNGGILITPSSQMFGNLAPWLRAGAVYRKVEVDIDNFDEDFDADSHLGFEVGGGLDFPLGQVISVTPGVRYVSYKPSDNDNADNLNYVVADVGLRFRF